MVPESVALEKVLKMQMIEPPLSSTGVTLGVEPYNSCLLSCPDDSSAAQV